MWNYKQEDFQAFRNAETKFDECFSNGDVNDACTKWTELFLATAKEYVPKRLVTFRVNDSPWYTNKLRAMQKQMMRLFHKFKHSKLPMDWKNYRKTQNEYQNGLDTAKNDYKKSLTESVSSNKYS